MGEVVPMAEDEPKAAQLALFEGAPVHEYKASLAAGGYLALDEELKVGSRVTIAAEGHVSKVIFHSHKGITTRQHVVVIDSETVEIGAGKK